MKLADWLHRERLTPEQLRRMLGVKNRSTAVRYLTGQRIPSPRTLQKIHDLTGGEVTLSDFLDTAPPRCAEVIIDYQGEPRLVFPWSRGKEVQEAAFDRMRSSSSTPLWSDPVTKAMEVLGDRVRVTKRGLFLLDGRIADIRRVVKAANEVLRAHGQPEIRYPGLGGNCE